MLRSWLPVPSLIGVLLMLCPELLVGNPEGLSDLPLDDEQLQNVLAFTVEQYNRDNYDINNYYRILKVVKAQSQVTNRDKYCLKLNMVRTPCQKESKLGYHEIQNCGRIYGRANAPTCFFKVTISSPPNEMNLAMTACSTSTTPPPSDVFCSG